MSSDLQTDWRCYCFVCHRSFIVSHPSLSVPSTTQCPSCKITFGEIERVYRDWTGINYTSGFRRLRKHKKGPNKKLNKRVQKTSGWMGLSLVGDSCIVPWLKQSDPQIIPSREFHEWWLQLKNANNNK